MPDISGFEILRQLRSQKTTKSLPVLIYTSKPLSEPERAQLETWHARIVRKEDVPRASRPSHSWIGCRSAGFSTRDRNSGTECLNAIARILVVDDREENRYVLVRVLRQARIRMT